jgi:23S rRNA (cytosine1962-C5)-methyltransferase
MATTHAHAGKHDWQVLEQRGPSPDHPVSTTCLENEYLKCFICRVA